MRSARCLALALAAWKAAADGPACLDGEGRSVDFWYVFKHPDGVAYTYADATQLTLRSPEDTVDSDTSPVTRTLLQAYGSGVASAMWNDEHADGKEAGAPYGHAKGVVAFKKGGGFWLTHSLPKFPKTVAQGFEGSWEGASTKYGQSFLCLSVGTAALQQVGAAMVTNRPSVYDVAAPAFVAKAVPNFAGWTGGEHEDTPLTKVQSIKTKAGTSFRIFSKSADFGKDLYAELVAPQLDADLITETWMHGRGNLPSACGSKAHDVMNSKAVEIGGVDWTDTQDHSKWAVTTTGTVLCVGDINRQSGQFKRGGGTLCLEEPDLAAQLRKAVTKFQSCKETPILV